MPKPFRHLLLASVACLGVAVTTAHAEPMTNGRPAGVIPDRMEPLTPQFKRDTKDVGITEHLGDTIPLDLPFTDSTGRSVTLGDYFHQKKPVILQLGYFNCPMLCDVVSKGMMDGVKDLDLKMGTDYDVLYVSVNPKEHWELGQRKKANYVDEYGRAGAASGWNFLVGTEEPIKLLADSVGFGFRKVEGRDEFSHPPMIVILTAEGKISRYFYGFQYPSATLRTGLVEAGQGKVGSYVEQIVVALCYHFDEYSGKYSADYMKLMQAGGILTVLTVGAWLGRRWIKDARTARAAAGLQPHA